MLACSCLNVIVETESDDFAKVKPDLHLSADEAKDPFFKQDVCLLQKIGKVLKVHSSLVDCRNIGSWTVHHCLNCNVCTHAIHTQKGLSFVLVNTKLLTSPNIMELKQSNQLSNVFNIIVDTNVEEENSYDYLPAELELAISNLKQQANDFIKRESAATEERVRVFTEQQCAALEEYRERALNEQRALTRIILNSQGSLPPKVARTSMDTSAPVSVTKAAPATVPEENNAKPAIIKQAKVIMNVDSVPTPERKLSHRPVSQKNSFDAEGLFELEDMDNSECYSNLDDDLSDSEDKEKEEGGINIKQTNAKPMNMAKSLPMTIPVFFNPFLNRENEDQEDMLHHPEDPMDIAASIKALARSVHGDTVFGDLPRPRCSTNI